MKIRASILAAILALGAACGLASCSSQNKVDYVSKCKLTDYISESYTASTIKNKQFLTNGIGYATVKKFIDGDTTHFYETDTLQTVVKARYLGVDTPESTGQIEPYGKKASNFTKSKLETAKTIVLTTEVSKVGSAASPDSTGSRFTAFVWISDKENASLSELKLLNLWLVQEGLSTGKSITGSPLSDFFTTADLQAQKLKLNIWSGKDDPDFYEGPAYETTLQELAETYEEDGPETSFNGAKVKFEGIVCRLAGNYDAYLYMDGVGDAVGRKFGIYVFAGYKNYSPLRHLGYKISVIGNYSIYMGNPQISNVHYDAFVVDEENDMKVVSKDNPYEISDTTADLVQNRESINMIYNIKGLNCYQGKTEIDATTHEPSGALTLRCKDDNDVQLSIRVPDDIWALDEEGRRVTDATYFEGKRLNVTGAICFFAPDEDDPDYGYYQIKICDKSDLSIVPAN